ncbi:hypothetical protein D3C75_916150 [compost metagenome]
MTKRLYSSGSSAIWAAPLITRAMVPGPHMLGMVSGTKAMLWLMSTPADWLGAGNSMRKPMKAMMRPPASRRPGMEIPNRSRMEEPMKKLTQRVANR